MIKYILKRIHTREEIGIYGSLFIAQQHAYEDEPLLRGEVSIPELKKYRYGYVVVVEDLDSNKDCIEYFYILDAHKSTRKWAKQVFPFVEKIEHRGIVANIYLDDYGQCVFYKFRDASGILNESSCGTYNLDYSDDVKYMIDYALDHLYTYSESPYYGAALEYMIDQQDNIRKLFITYRKQQLHAIDESLSLDQQIALGKHYLDILLADPDFQKQERDRIKKGDLYFHELMEKKNWIL